MPIVSADTLALVRHAAIRDAIHDVLETGEPRTVTITSGRATRTITVRRLESMLERANAGAAVVECSSLEVDAENQA